MKKMSYWGMSVAFLALGLNAFGNLEATASTVSNATPANNTQESQPSSVQSDLQLAQLIGACRAANRTIDIFSQPSVGPATSVLRTLFLNERVTLSSEGDNSGFIQVSNPTRGYVIARYLTQIPGCGGTGPGPTASCRRANVALAIRSGAGLNFPDLPGSGVGAGGVIRLTNPEQVQTNAGENNRRWYAIVQPRSGWVTSGFGTNNEANLGPRFACS